MNLRELENALYGHSFYKLTATDNYLDWLRDQFSKYQSYINQEADRTGRFPTSHMKDFLSLLNEQNQTALAAQVKRDITKYS